MRGQARRLQTSGLAQHGTHQAFQAGFGRQQFTQAGFDPGARIGLVKVGRPAGAADQGAEFGLRHALRMDAQLQQAQGDIDQRFGRQRRPGDKGKVAFVGSPAGAHGRGMEAVVERGFQQPLARRQIGDGDADAWRRHAAIPGGRSARQPVARPVGGGDTLGFGIGQRNTERRRTFTPPEIKPEQLDTAGLEHHQQARDQRIGRDETGNAEARRQAADAALDAFDAPCHHLVRHSPAARLAILAHLLLPAQEGAVFAGMQCRRHRDAPRSLQAGRLHRGQRHSFAIEQFRCGAGVPGNDPLPQAALLRAREKASRHTGRRNFPAQQRRRSQVIEPHGRRRTLQRLPGHGAARHLQVAMGAAQVEGQSRRGAQHQRLRSAGQFGQLYSGQIGTDQEITLPAAASARPGRTGL